MFGGMIGAYAPYQMSGLTTGFPMGFPLGPPGYIHQPWRSGHPAVQPSRLSSLLLPCISDNKQPRRYGSTGCEDQLGVDRPTAQALRNCGGGWPPNSHQNLDPLSQADHPPVGTTRFGGRAQVGEEDPRDGQQKPNHTHGPARVSNRERRSQSDMEMDE
ncbi:hypothetical protein RvY_14196 [Ramazzottius varieornatus]|uniref:Uncharacterized protein n=1 Tax=Ramazzottius varieornatus TaxID=947166 RepID=A0A1D1VQI9_RAMVA|nr:hypothetical protein RvY_14196 [Ramazzottius varieornatus]